MELLSNRETFTGAHGLMSTSMRLYSQTRSPVDGCEQNLKELNAVLSKSLRDLLSSESEVDDAALISINSKGIDVRVCQGAQFNIQRLPFENGHGVETLEEEKDALGK